MHRTPSPLWLLLLLFLLSSCKTVKNIPYFQNSAKYNGTGKGYLYDMTIKPKDQLTIFVFSGTENEVVNQFNIRDIKELDINSRSLSLRGGYPVHHYLVDNDGNIDFPVLGQLHLSGFTIGQASKYITELIAPYMKSSSDYLVTVRIDNYDISVMGEVNRPNTFNVTRDKISVLEALAMAGDMTIYGKRDNVKLLRERPDGEYEIHELDLRDANILDSPYYYMHQRDILYVEPNLAMSQNASIGTTRQLWVRGTSITIALGSLLYRVLR